MCARLRYMHAHEPGIETHGLTVYARMYGAFLRHTVGGRSVIEGSTRPEWGCSVCVRPSRGLRPEGPPTEREAWAEAHAGN